MLLGTKRTKIAKAIKPKALGFVLYEGPSALTGDPIVVIITLKTSNRKTGQMAQVWILHAEVNPVEALALGLDEAVCGNCPHRKGPCYVNVGQAPLAVYRAYHNGRYEAFDPAIHSHYITGTMVRLGAYGDPAAAPVEVMEQIVDLARAHTGYTHQINHKGFDKRFIDLCMVSADTPKQARKYQSMGAHTFRVALEGDSLDHGEIECLADTGQGIQCVDCGLCDGTKKNIAITVHGSGASKFKSAMVIPSVMVA